MLKPSGVSFEKFKEKRVMKARREFRRHDYRTTSKKIEIHSEQLENMGYAPMPLWEELSQVPETPEDYPLLLTNAKEEAYMLSGFKHVATLRLMRPDPVVELHPETAGNLGIEDGDWVYIETRQGRIKQKLSVNRAMDPRVVMAAFGWWFPERAEEGYGWSDSNLNILTPSGPDYDPSTGGVTLRGIPCKVYATGAE